MDPAYYGLSGYTGYSVASTQLDGAGESLSLTFRYCLSDGILLHAEDSSGALYFSLGVHNVQILVEFDTGEGLREVCTYTTVASSPSHTYFFVA